MPSDSAILSQLIKNMHAEGEEPIRPLLDAYFIERQGHPGRLTSFNIDLTERPRPHGRFSPSSLCGCHRQAVFKFMGVRGTRKVDSDKELIFMQGNWIHHKWNATFADMQAVLGKERLRVISVEEDVQIPELYIAGSLDTLLSVKKTKRLGDYKSIRDDGYHRVYISGQPIPEHVRQLTTYLKARRIPKGFLLYDNKNNQHVKIFHIDLEGVVWEEVAEWTEECIHQMERELLPPMHPDCNRGNFLYERCPYSYICFGGKSDLAIRRKMFRDFPGVDELWQEGLRAANPAS